MDGFKQRIIGALVLISLAVIFVPMLLDEPHEERSTRSIEIPEQPNFPEVRIERAEPPQNDTPIAAVPEPQDAPLQTSPASETAPEPRAFDEQTRVSPAAEQSIEDAGSVAGADGDNGTAASDPEAPVQTQPEPAPAPETTQPRATTAQSSVQAQPEAGGYLVQLGSFGSSANAEKLMGSVRDSGFGAHTTTVASDGQTLTRVFAGPFADKAAAEAAKRKLDGQFGLNTLVVVNDR